MTLKGIEPEKEASVTSFADKMLIGTLARLVEPPGEDSVEAKLPGLVVGEELAMTLGVFIGDSVKVTTPEGHLTPFGMVPRTRNFRIAGIFRLGLYDYDNSWALLHLPDAQRLLGVGDVLQPLDGMPRVLHRDGQQVVVPGKAREVEELRDRRGDAIELVLRLTCGRRLVRG